MYVGLLILFFHVHNVFTNFRVIFSWINNDLEVALVGTKVDLTYDYDVSQEIQRKIKTKLENCFWVKTLNLQNTYWIKLVSLSYLEGRPSLYSTFIKWWSSMLLLLPYSLPKKMGKAKKKKYLWLNSTHFFCKTDLDLVLSEFLSWNLHYKKKNPDKIIKCFCIMYFYDLYFKLDHLGYKKQGHMS